MTFAGWIRVLMLRALSPIVTEEHGRRREKKIDRWHVFTPRFPISPEPPRAKAAVRGPDKSTDGEGESLKNNKVVERERKPGRRKGEGEKTRMGVGRGKGKKRSPLGAGEMRRKLSTSAKNVGTD